MDSRSLYVVSFANFPVGLMRLSKTIPSGEHTKSYGKWPFIVEFPIKNGDFPLLC